VINLVKQYVDLVKDVEEIEHSSTKPEFNTIDISSIDMEEERTTKPEFKSLLTTAMNIETGHIKDDTPKQKAQQQKQAVQMQATTNAAQSSVQSQMQYKKPEPQESVKNEIGAYVKDLGKKIPEQEKPINSFSVKIDSDDDLVLSQLSTPDQISELERIIEGIREHAFDRYHIEIVKKELNGLNKRIATERKEAKSQNQPNGIEESFAVLRDQRLAEAIALLSDTK
jgi:hypothetical protein